MNKSNKPTLVIKQSYKKGQFSITNEDLSFYATHPDVKVEIRDAAKYSDDSEQLTVTFHISKKALDDWDIKNNN